VERERAAAVGCPFLRLNLHHRIKANLLAIVADQVGTLVLQINASRSSRDTYDGKNPLASNSLLSAHSCHLTLFVSLRITVFRQIAYGPLSVKIKKALFQ
jgi:hypothetical protein